jgi:WD40 repeat protein
MRFLGMSIKDSGGPAGAPPRRSSAAPGPLETTGQLAADGRFDAFVSYRRIPADAAFVDGLQQDLAKRGMRVWVDREEIEPASDWAERIVRGIDASKALIFVITPESVRSAECLRELDKAVELHKLVVPVLLREVADRRELPEALARPNWVMFTPGSDPGHAIDALTEALSEDLEWRDEHSRYTIRSAEWTRAGHDKSFLLRGSDLRSAEQWLTHAAAHPKTPPTAEQTAYIVASRKGAVRTQRTWQVALSAGLAVTLALAVVAFLQRNEARYQAQVANSRAQAEQAIAGLTSDPQQSVSEALSATKTNASAQTENALRLAIADDHLRMTIQSGTGANTAAAWNPVLGQIAASAKGGDVALWNTRTGRVTQLLPTGGDSPVIQLTYDASGSRLAAVTLAGRVAVWDVSPSGAATAGPATGLNGTVRTEITSGPTDFGVGTGAIQATWAGADGAELYVFGAGLSNVAVLDLASGAAGPLYRASPGAPVGVDNLAPSPDGSALLANGQIVDFAPGPGLTVTRQITLSPGAGSGSNTGLSCWLPDGLAVVTSPNYAESSTERTYSAATGKESAPEMATPAGPVTAVTCSPSANDPWVAAGDSQGNVILRLAGGTVVPLSGHSDDITSIASSPDGRYLATASLDGTAQVWNAANGKLVAALGGNGGAGLTGVQFAPDSRRVLTVDNQGFVRVWDAGIGEPAADLESPAHGAAVPLGFTSSGRQVSGIDVDTSTGKNAAITSVAALTWDALTGRLTRSTPLPGIAPVPMPCSAAEVSLGTPIATTSPAECHVPPPPRLAQLMLVTGAAGDYPQDLAVAASPDGEHVAYARAHSVAVVDSGGKQVASLPVAGRPTGLTFGPGPDDLLVMTSTAIYLWQPLTGRPPLEVRQPTAPIDAAVSASGAVLAAADTGGTVGVWNAVTGQAIRTFRPADNHSSSYYRPDPLRVALSADGGVVASGNADGTVFFWDTASGKLIAMHRISDYPIIELSPASDGSALLAVDWPQAGTGVNPPAAGAVLDFATGQVAAGYESTTPFSPGVPINPGAGLSPDGSFLYAGSMGLAPAPPGGTPTVYQVNGGQAMTGLPGFLTTGSMAYSEFPAQPWSPDGTTILAGNGVYRCDACQDLQGLQATATSRDAWAAALSVGSDHPPATDPYS